jgi:hypothetical protein
LDRLITPIGGIWRNMKFSAILVSLSLPIAAQTAAQAQESSTVDFLKTSLSPVDAQPAALPKSKIALSALRAETKSLKAANTIKLRPFVAGRKLPRQRDLELELLSQTPRMAAVQAAPLSGQISEFATQPIAAPMDLPPINRTIATYDAATLARVSSPRAVPNQTPTVPGQVRVMRQPRSRARQIALPPQQSTTASADWLGQPRQGERMLRQSGALLVQAPVIAPTLNNEKLAELGYPSADELDAPSPPTTEIIRPPQQDPMQQAGGAGPAPFPLSLLPQDQLKSLIAGRNRNKISAPPAYFGSWHGPPTSRNLPPGGFQTHMRSKGFSTPSTTSYSHFAPRPSHKPVNTHQNIAQVQQALHYSAPPEMRIASYPPYALQPPLAQ